jgi:hypothetical protein
MELSIMKGAPMPKRLTLLCTTLLALVVLTPACTKFLRSPVQVDAIHIELRERYIAAYPDDLYLEQIVEQKIVIGMNPTQVFLSWGKPFHRFKDGDAQKWIYEFSDDGLMDNQPKTVTHLFFEQDELVRWKHDHGYVYFHGEDPGADFTDELKDLPSTGSSGSQKQ